MWVLWRAIFSAKMLIVVLTGFMSGLPLLLTGSTLQAWMKDEQVDLAMIGIFSIVGLPYTLKFLWSPVMDRYVPLGLGRRRSWMLITQAALVATIAALGLTQPSQAPWTVAVVAVLVTFCSASQDIVYPVSEVAGRHGASAEAETPNPKEAYAPFGRSADAPYRGQLDS